MDKPTPKPADIWVWDRQLSPDPLLLLQQHTRVGYEDDILFYCLNLRTGKKYHMSFHPSIMGMWEYLA